ncbi:MAG: family 10 glycosylhydrolase [Bacteroidetes bacterium]|nr:family 10 glycosylhydrolase [Bacteroidota bacterium]
MRKIVHLVITLFIVNSITISTQAQNPKREFRGVWVASVTNLDWPTSPYLSTEAQKTQLIELFDDLKETGFNVIIFQVRPECDALYNSPFEPWSYWLTGNQGAAPNPYYDPLEFAVEEAHKRGMELHAWFNPYRAVYNVGSYQISSNHVTEKHPEWVLTFGNLKILNPGLPDVRDYNTEIIMDVVRRYDIDGIHFDDYFYPYPPNQITNQDASTYSEFSRGFTNLGDWRRDNVNIFINQVYGSIQLEKPWVKFGISPFGIWKPNYPTGISGLDAYKELYADPMAWLQHQSIDYMTPQLYWPHGGGQDYGKLMPWWADSIYAHDRHFYPGQAAYRIPNWADSEAQRQIRANRKNPKTLGSVFFRARVGILDNPKGFADSLKNDFYKNPALIPVMDWKDQVSPNPVTNLKYGKLADIRGDGLLWDVPASAADGDSASMYAVYKFDFPSVQQSDLENSSNLNNIVGTNYSALKAGEDLTTGQSYFAVTALDRNYNESSMSQVVQVQVQTPAVPVIFSPVNFALNQKDTIVFTWEDTPHSNFNRLQIASDENFSNLLVNQNSIVDTFKSVTGFKGLSTYYWRVTASNLAGESDYSEVRSFTTGFPIAPILISPIDKKLDVELTPQLVWNTTEFADQYRVQVAEGLSIEPEIIIIDTIISDTTFITHELNVNKIYTWSVGAINEFGFSGLADVFKFKTQTTTDIETTDNSIPINYALEQNYPNPFNPSTTITFALPESGFTVLRVFNILGQQVKELVNKNLNPGNYSVEFNAGNLPSGMYVYVLQSGSQLFSKKMMLIK